MLRSKITISLAILSKIFIEGYLNCIEDSIHPHVSGTSPDRFEKHVKDIKSIANEGI